MYRQMNMVIIKQSNYTADPVRLVTQLALYQISENAGLFYTVIALIPLVIYFDFCLPTLNEAEEKYLKRLALSEIVIVICQPLLMLLSVGLLYIIALVIDWPPLYTFFTYGIIFGGIFYFPGYLTLKQKIKSGRSSSKAASLNYDIISKTTRECYLVGTVSLYALICAITGPNTFGFKPSGSVYNFPPQSVLPWPYLRFVDKNGVYAAIDLNRGYLTLFFHMFVPEWIFFLVMFYLSHLYLATSMRVLMFYAYFVFDMFAKIYNWLRGGRVRIQADTQSINNASSAHVNVQTSNQSNT